MITTERNIRGSALLSAVISMVILTIMCVSFGQLVLQEKKAAVRFHYNFCLLNAAEAGLEGAIWAINEDSWEGWNSIQSGKDKYKPNQKIIVGPGLSATVDVLIQNQSTAPVIYATAFCTLPNQDVVSKQLRISYASSDPSGGGMIAKDRLELSGGPSFDSYDSRKGPPHPTLNRGDKVTVATTSTASDGLKISSDVTIYGYGGTAQHNPDLSGSNILIYGADTLDGTTIDSSRIFNDFTFEFPPVTEPDWSGSITSLPGMKDGKITLGDPGGSPRKYKLDKLDLSDGTVEIVGPVQIHLQDGMSVSGGANIAVASGGSVELYTPKDVTISGQGIVNKTSHPDNFKVFGTVQNANDQTFSLSGQGLMEANFYFPNGKINISGQCDLAGSAVGNEVSISGQVNFHYDVSLDSGSDGDPGISDWHELTKPEHVLDLTKYAKSADFVAVAER